MDDWDQMHQSDTCKKISKDFNCPHCGKVVKAEIPIELLRMFDYLQSVVCDDCASIEDAKRSQEALAIKISAIEAMSNIPQEFMRFDRNKGNSELAKSVYLATGDIIYFHGQHGTGKSRCMCAAMRKHIAVSQKRCQYRKFDDIRLEYLEALRSSENKARMYLTNLTACDILALDDIAMARLTDSTGGLLLSLIDGIYERRYKCRLWMTANTTLAEFCGMFERDDHGAAILARFRSMEKDGRFMVMEAGK